MMRQRRYCAFTYYLLALYLTTETVTGDSPEKNKNVDDEADLYNLKPSTETEHSAQNKIQIKDLRLNNDKDSVMLMAGDDVGKSVSRDDKSLNSLLKSVLITLRDHPEIIWEIIKDEEMTKGRYFQRPSPQLQLAPKRVEKKAGSRTYNLLKGNSKNYYQSKYASSSSSSDESTEHSDNSKSKEANYYKTKYDSDSSERSEHTLEENSKDSEENSPSSSDESITVPIDKRVPEKPEETIDITTLTKPSNNNDVDLTDIPSEGGLEDVPEYKGAEENDSSENIDSSNNADEETDNIKSDKETSDEPDAKEFGDGE